MKRFLLTAVAALFVAAAISAQTADSTYVRNGNDFTKVVQVHKSTDTQTVYTFTIKDTSYPIWITKNGRCYILRMSKNGNQYKQYLEESIARQVCAELSIEYKENNK